LRVSLRLEITTSSPSSWLLKTLARRTEESASGLSGDWPTPLQNDDHAKVRKRGNYNLPATVMWPTPDSAGGGRSPKDGMTLTGQTPDGKKRQVDLNHAVMEWPTPTVHGNTNRKGATAKSGDGLRTVAVLESARPTPTAQDGKNATLPPSQVSRDTLPGAILRCSGPPAPENPSTNGKSRASSLIGELISQFRYSMRIQEVGEVLLEWLVISGARLNPRWVCQLMGFTADWLDDVEWPPSKPSATRSSRKSPRS
jgi:hypothetical protein